MWRAVLLLLIVLVSCAPAAQESLPTLALLPTEAPSSTPALTLTATLTATNQPTVTSEPSATATLPATEIPTTPIPAVSDTPAADQPVPPGVIVIPAGPSPTPRFVPQPYPEPVEVAEIMVAAVPIPAGLVIQAEMMTRAVWPVESLPEDIITESGAALGLIARGNIGCGEPLQASLLTSDEDNLLDQAANWPPAPCPTAGILPKMPYTYAQIVVAAQELALDQPVSAEDVKLWPWPAELVPPGAFFRLEDVVGGRPIAVLLPEQPLSQSMLIPPR